LNKVLVWSQVSWNRRLGQINLEKGCEMVMYLEGWCLQTSRSSRCFQPPRSTQPGHTSVGRHS